MYQQQLGAVIGRKLGEGDFKVIQDYLNAKQTVYKDRYPGETGVGEGGKAYRKEVMAGLEELIGRMK